MTLRGGNVSYVWGNQYEIQERKWYGWKTIFVAEDKNEYIEKIDYFEGKGHTFIN